MLELIEAQRLHTSTPRPPERIHAARPPGGVLTA